MSQQSQLSPTEKGLHLSAPFKSPYKTTKELLAAVTAGAVLPADIQKHTAAIELAAQKPLHIKESEKGCVSAYGLQRFPVSLYPSQWLRLLDTDEGKKICKEIVAKSKAMLEAGEEPADKVNEAA